MATTNVVYVKEIRIVVKDMTLTTPVDPETAHSMLHADTDIETRVIDSMVIFETKDGKKEWWNEPSTLQEAVDKEANN